MAIPQKRALSETQMLHREIESQGEWLARERLERKTELDRLKLQIEALKRTLERLSPKSSHIFATELKAVEAEFNPETS
jgi:hypothetical protein